MRVGVISDIHGNDVAFAAVLDALAPLALDRLVCLGDVAVLGPEPAEVIARLRSLDCDIVMGNTDEWLLDRWEPLPDDTRGRRLVELTAWGKARLADDDLAFLETFHQTVELDLGAGVRLLCYHGKPGSTTEGITAGMAEDQVREALDGAMATLCIGGHTHQQMSRRVGGQWVINAGSVGLTFRRTTVDGSTRRPPWAEFAVIAVEGGAIDVSLRAVPLDLDRVFEAARQARLPYLEWWIQSWAPEEVT